MKKAFTLIELLVVVLIIGILAAIALPQYEKAVEKARVAEALTNIATMKRAIDMYIMEKGWPSGFIGLQDILEATGTELSGGKWQGEGGATLLSYYTKNFSYRGDCSSGMCEIIIDRESENGYYSLAEFLYSDQDVNGHDAGWTAVRCVTQDTDFGRRICKSLPDYAYVDGEV